MSIRIKQTHPNELTINGKRIYRNVNGRWVVEKELTAEEAQAFRMHIQSLHAEIDVKANQKYWTEQSTHVEK